MPSLHLADLKKTSAATSEIVLFEDVNGFVSTEPSHNVVPPHGKIASARIKWLVGANCFDVRIYKFCGENDRLNSRLKLSVISGNLKTEEQFLGGSISDILLRFIGAPTAKIHTVIDFGKDTFGLVHSYGFSLVHNGKFCDPVATNPNGKESFGVDGQGKPLIFTSVPLAEVDKLVEGWREYDIERLCSSAVAN